jgi:hypothetical protein
LSAFAFRLRFARRFGIAAFGTPWRTTGSSAASGRVSTPLCTPSTSIAGISSLVGHIAAFRPFGSTAFGGLSAFGCKFELQLTSFRIDSADRYRHPVTQPKLIASAKP